MLEGAHNSRRTSSLDPAVVAVVLKEQYALIGFDELSQRRPRISPSRVLVHHAGKSRDGVQHIIIQRIEGAVVDLKVDDDNLPGVVVEEA